MHISVCKTSHFWLCHSLNISEIRLFQTIYCARKPADSMMISTENIYIIFLLNSHENHTETILLQPHVGIMVDKKGYLQTAVKDKCIFSSPEPKAQGEVLWSLTFRRRRRRRPSVRPSVRLFTIFKQHLLLNHWLDFDQISQEWSLVDSLSKLFKWFRSIAYLGHRS